MDIWKLFVLVVGLCCIIAIFVVVRRIWRAATDPGAAYKLGRKARRLGRNTGYAAVGAAHAAGRTAGKIESLAGVVGRSFRDGRDSAKNDDSAPDGGA